MKKVVCLFLILLLLFSNIIDSFAWTYLKGGQSYNLPDGIAANITVGGKQFNLNFDILKERGLCVYGDYSNIAGNEQKGTEWRYLGYTLSGGKYTNEFFPNDIELIVQPWEKNWIKEPWSYNLGRPSVFNDNPQASTWLDSLEWPNWNGERLKDYLIIQSPPSEYTPGSCVGYHKLADGRVFYQTFTLPAMEKVKPEPVINTITPDFTLGNSGYLGGPGTYYINTINGANEGESFTITNSSCINSEHWDTWLAAKHTEGYTVTFAWSVNPAGIINVSSLGDNGGTSIALSTGKTKLRLTMNLLKNGVVEKTGYTEKEISVVTEDFMPIVTAPPTAKLNTSFKVELLKSSVLKFLGKIKNIKWYIGESETNLIYHPELENKYDFPYSSSKVCKLNFQAYVDTTEGGKYSNIAVTDFKMNATAKADIDIPDETYEGVYFNVTTNGSRVYYTDEEGRNKSTSLSEADEKGYAGYSYDASVEYAEHPENKLDASGGAVYFDTLGRQWMQLWVYPSGSDDVSDMDYTTVKPCPKAVIEAKGLLKENRKVMLDASKTLYHIKYPRLPTKTYLRITQNSTGSKYTIYEGQSLNNPIIKTRLFTALKMDLHFTTAGDYTVLLHTEDVRGNSSEATTKFKIRPDEAPVSDFFTMNKSYRNPDTSIADIQITTRAQSTDGDYIGNLLYRYKYDSDNDGSFADETWTTFVQGANIDTTVLATPDVGKIQLELTATEEPVGEVLPEFFTQSLKRSAVTLKSFEIDNIPPITSLMLLKEKKQDILLLSDEPDTANNMVSSLIGTITNDPNYLLKPTVSTDSFSTSTDMAVQKKYVQIAGNGNIDRTLDIGNYYLTHASDNKIYIYLKSTMELVETLQASDSNLAKLDEQSIFFTDFATGKITHYNMDTRIRTTMSATFTYALTAVTDGRYVFCYDQNPYSSGKNIYRFDLSTGAEAVVDWTGKNPYNYTYMKLMGAYNGKLFFSYSRYNYINEDDYRQTHYFAYMGTDMHVVDTGSHLLAAYVYMGGYNVGKVGIMGSNYLVIFMHDTYSSNGGATWSRLSYALIDKNTGQFVSFYEGSLSSGYSSHNYPVANTYYGKINGGYYFMDFISYNNGGYGNINYIALNESFGVTNYQVSYATYAQYAMPQINPYYMCLSGSNIYSYNMQVYTASGSLISHERTENLKYVENSASEVIYRRGPIYYDEYPLPYHYIADAYSNTVRYNLPQIPAYLRAAYKYQDCYFLIPDSGSSVFYTWSPTKGLQTINVGFAYNYFNVDVNTGRLIFVENRTAPASHGYKVFKYNKGFFEITDNINAKTFAPDSSKYIAIYTQNPISYRSDQLESLVTVIKAKGAKVFFVTRANNQTFANSVTGQTGGRYEYFDSWDADITSCANFIKGQEGDKTTNGKTIYAAKGETINYIKYFGDYENDPQHAASGEKWLYIHTPANDGLASFHNRVLTTPVTSFTKDGTYVVYYNGRDNPKANDSFDIYRKWSNSTPLTVIVGQGSAPAPLQLDVSISGEMRQYHRIDFKVQAVKGSYDINWSSLRVTFDGNDFLPYENPTTGDFSRAFKNTGSHTVKIMLSDVNGMQVTAARTFNIAANLAPIAGFTVTSSGARQDNGSAKFKITKTLNPTDDSIGTIEYFVRGVKYNDNGDGSFTPAGYDYFKVEPNEYGEIELNQVGTNYVKQIVTEYYSNGTGPNGEDLDNFRVFLTSEAEQYPVLINGPPLLSYEVNPGAVLVSDGVNHVTKLIDDTPAGDYIKYKFIHNDSYYQNSNGPNPRSGAETHIPEAFLNYKGLYDFYASAFDEDGGATAWIYGGQVKVCSKPVADFELVSNSYLNGGKNLEFENKSFMSDSIVTINNLSYNEDYGQSRPDYGIEYIKVEYRNAADMNFIELYEEDNVLSYISEFNLPPLKKGVYEVKMTVKNPEGFYDQKIMRFNMLELRLDAELEPAVVAAGDNYMVKVTLSHDGMGAAAQLSDGTLVLIEEAGHDSENTYYETEITVPETTQDNTYPITVFGLYPFRNELKKTLFLKVVTPVELVPQIPPEVTAGSTIELDAVTSKYVNSVKARLFNGTRYETGAINFLLSTADEKKDWKAFFSLPGNIPDGEYTASFTASTPNGNVENKELKFSVSSLEITGVTVEGYWNHWRGQTDIFGEAMTTEPHRFLGLERVKISAEIRGFADRVEFRFSPELEAMSFTNELGHVYDYSEDFFGYYVNFPEDSKFIIDEPEQNRTVTWEYTLPLARSTVSWDNIRKRQPYSLTVTAYRGERCDTYEIDDLDMTGNIYDLTYIQPVN